MSIEKISNEWIFYQYLCKICSSIAFVDFNVKWNNQKLKILRINMMELRQEYKSYTQGLM